MDSLMAATSQRVRALRRPINGSDKSEEDQRDEGYGHGGSKAATEELLATIAVVDNTRGNARHAGYGSSVLSATIGWGP